jgi:hypothetical protein
MITFMRGYAYHVRGPDLHGHASRVDGSVTDDPSALLELMNHTHIPRSRAAGGAVAKEEVKRSSHVVTEGHARVLFGQRAEQAHP